jgi:hypothetical protein
MPAGVLQHSAPLRPAQRSLGGDPATQTDDILLATMSTLAVRSMNAMVSRVRPHQMKQDHQEPVAGFLSILRGQAAICAYMDQPKNCVCGK